MNRTLLIIALLLVLRVASFAQASGWIELTNISTMNSINPPPSEVTALASNSSYLFATSSPDAVRRSADGGASWQYGINAFYIFAMAANDAHLFAADKYGNVYRYEYDGSNRSSFGRLPDITGYSRIPTSMTIMGDYLFVSTLGGKYFKRALYELSGVTPTASAATSIGATAFTAGWSVSTGDLGYRLDVATDAGFTALVEGYNNKDVGNVATYNVTGLSPNTAYYYRVRACNVHGTSESSNVVTLHTTETPVITTQAVSGVAATTATGNGNITILGYPIPTAYGVCWNKTGTPTTADSKVDKGTPSATGTFTAAMSSLTPATTYYVRAYTTNADGTVYGEVVSFVTLPLAATVTTQPVSNIRGTTATGNGNIPDLGVPNPTDYGVCWSTTSGAETVTGNYVSNGAASATGAFTASITGLECNTTYYVKAYATNTAGTTYGNELSFTTGLFDGTGIVGDPYLIYTAEQLNSVRNYIGFGVYDAVAQCFNNQNVYFKLMNDIDLTSYLSSGNPGNNSGAFWPPIGDNSNPFTCQFDGNGHVIRGLKISRPTEEGLGLFGYISQTASIKNLGVEADVLNVNSNSGILVGRGAGVITGCYAKGTIEGPGDFIGGIIGYCFGSILNSYANVAVTGNKYIGGLAGAWEGVEMNNCYAVGKVNATTTDVSKYQGGLIGVDGRYEVKPSVSDRIINSFWDKETTAQTTSVGTDDSYGKTTAEMKAYSTFNSATWDFKGETTNGTAEVWNIGNSRNNGYPYLSWQYPSDPGFAGTWTGATDTDWNKGTNWAGGAVPTSVTDVIIPTGVPNYPIISATTTATCNNLTVSGTLTIQSSASGTGSLIVNGASTGTVNCERYMTSSMWHWVSPLAVGGSVNTFILNASNAVALSGSNYGMMDYNETSNVWNPYFTTATTGNFTAGKGYGIRRSTDGVATFTGTLTTGTNTVAITKGGAAGWNLIGNPYTSSIYMNTTANASYNFIATNSSKLDASYACIYLWDVATSTYKILGNTSYSGRDLDINVFAPGQAFFVKAASAGTVEFNKNMQVQQTGATFKAPAVTTSWSGIVLKAASADASSSAIITFNEKMTKGLDPTYDAGLLRGTNGLSLYTRLVEDNGVDFAIQCLPENYNNLVIPVGVDCKDGGEITFSAETVELPKNCKVMIEDKTTNTFTSLAEGGIYKTTVLAGSSSAGRFYIHTSGNTTTGTAELTADINSLKAYIANEAIIIEGEVSDKAIATLYNLQGLKVHVNLLQKGSLNTLPCSGLMKGIYLLTIQQNGKTETKKLIKE